MDDIRSDYFFIPFPYISKSTFNMFKKCKYLFKRRVLDGYVPEPNAKMKLGTALHYLYYKFFDLIDADVLWGMDWQSNHDTIYSMVYNYFYTLIINEIDAQNSNNIYLISNIKAFCRMEENHWFALRNQFTNRRQIFYYFKQSDRTLERFLRNDQLKIFGTIDRIVHEPDMTLVMDYKTGKVPVGMEREKRTGLYTSSLPSYYVPEGTFYSILYLGFMGYTFGKDGDTWHIYKDGIECDKDAIKKLNFAFVFTGGYGSWPNYYVGRKKVSIVSVRSVLSTLETIRGWTNWIREPNYYKCRICPLFLLECEGAVPDEISRNIRRSEDTPPEDIHYMGIRQTGSGTVVEK